MFLLNWYREYLEIKSERESKKRELNYCSACETLKLQLAIANEERKLLINKLTDKPEVIEDKPNTNELKPIMPNRMNWNTRRQLLEAESREAAKLMKQNEAITRSSTEGQVLTIHEIEKELGVENG
jgi:hypothetical protein